ncbi:hypothetical protein PENTCL1PPCAC_21562 [Pristionchus entomophagus]|uniref:Uncharacterized protein n=1 Tax=Pristionchus entomophagus TaxID=358040 RepID=A0AAV5TYF1_9BILA|nr:hypothetical protein PENTCL1PPCAC_21562 [Pristionchus entomophagus]
MLIVIACLPARVIIMMMIPRVWWESSWRFGFYASSSLEMIGLILLSLFHDQSTISYYVHFASFGWWWIATLCVMAIVVYMQQATGLIDQDPFNNRLWLVKIFIFCAFVLGSCAISLSYPLASTFCSLVAFTIFCLGEYTH